MEDRRLPVHPHNAGPEPLFYRDTKGDRDNLAYGSIHKYSVPKYRLSGHGSLLGLSRDLKVVESSNGKVRKVTTHGRDSGRRHHQQSLLSAPEPTPPQHLTSQPLLEDDIDAQEDFIEVDGSRRRKRRRLTEPGAENPASETSSEDDDSDHQDQVNDQSFESFRNNPDRQRQRQLRERLSNDPQNVATWHELAEHQQYLVNDTVSRSKRMTASQRRTVTQLRIAVYEEALSNVHEDGGKASLVTSLMRNGATLWDRKRQAVEWEKLLKQDSSFEMWLLYIDFRQTDEQNFTIQKTLDLYQQVLRTYLSSVKGPDTDKHCIHLVSRLTSVLQQAGFQERAAALWQALLDFNSVKHASIAKENAITFFEHFWDSEVARLGDIGAKGWSSGSTTGPDAATDPEVPPVDPADLYHSWCGSERIATKCSKLAARTFDATSGDPFRVVLFDDIKDYMFLVSDQAHTLLLDAFVCLWGLPPVTLDCRLAPWRKDPYLLMSTNAATPSDSTIDDAFTGLPDLFTLFAALEDPSYSWSSSRHGEHHLWVYRALQQTALSKVHDQRVAHYVIALGVAWNCQDTVKFCRMLIKHSTDPVRLYNSYAIAQCRTGQFDKAEKTWSTILHVQPKKDHRTHADRLCLWRSWVWECISQGLHRRATNLLLSTYQADLDLTHLEDTASTTLPRLAKETEQKLRNALFEALSRGDGDTLCSCTDLLAFLLYYTQDRNIEAAAAVYKMALDLVPGAKALLPSQLEVAEGVHQLRARFLHFHVCSKNAIFKPRNILTQLADSVQAFPENSIFDKLFRQTRQKYGVIDRLRDISMSEALDAVPKPLTGYIRDIAIEQARTKYSGSTEHSIRAAFHRAFEEDSPLRACPALRLGHVRWELAVVERRQTSNLPSDKKSSLTALGAFHAALRASPWVKEIYLLAFESDFLQARLGQDGLKALYETMLERGLRIHIDISDLI